MFHIKEKPLAPDCQGIFVGGELDMSAAPELRDAIDRAHEKRVRCLVVDLSETTFVDSTSIGVLVGAHHRLEATRGSLAIVCANRNVRRTFEIAGLDQLIHIEEQLEEPSPAPVAS
jgi:anti-sigma B factor antagonist